MGGNHNQVDEQGKNTLNILTTKTKIDNGEFSITFVAKSSDWKVTIKHDDVL